MVTASGWQRYSDVVIALAVVLIVVMMIIPLPPAVLDAFLAFNLTAALVVMLAAMYITGPLQISMFPSLLLVMTLYRMALNVSSTRLILLTGEPGAIITQFGQFVVRGNMVVGFIIFLILVIVQFIVITKGAERVSEVAARFTLDAMPGKQMAIDADLNAGIISAEDAKQRRHQIAREADFYGAMDGASKFVKGDAIAGLIIVVVNLIGGVTVGVMQMGMGAGDALGHFGLLTIGDGLVTQIPALLISTATGMVVTRSAADQHMGQDLINQVLSNHRVLLIAASVLVVLALVPGMPTWPFLLMGTAAGGLGYSLKVALDRRSQVEEARGEAQPEMLPPEPVQGLLAVDPLEIELGYGLLPLADGSVGGDLMDRLVSIRRQVALELGLVLPYIRVRDNLSLPPNRYTVNLRGAQVAGGELQMGHYLAMDPGGVQEPVPGIETREPAFGLPALWIRADDQERAELAGYTVVDLPAVLTTHLKEVIKRHAHDLLGRQEVKSLVEMVRETHPALIEELTPALLSLGEMQKVLQNLLREGVSIRDLVTIFESLADHAGATRDTDMLTEFARAALGRQITLSLGLSERVKVITLHPETEGHLSQGVERSEAGTYLNLDPAAIQRLVGQIGRFSGDLAARGDVPVVLASPGVRPWVRRLIERTLPTVPVLSFNEIDPGMEIEAVGVVKL